MEKVGRASDCDAHVCDSCGATYTDLTAHLRWHPECDDEDYPTLVEDSSDDDSECGDCDAVCSLADVAARQDLRDLVADDLAELRFEYGYDGSDVDRLKKRVQKWVDFRDAEAHRALAPLLRKGVGKAEVQAALGAHRIFEGLETTARELGYTKRRVPYLEPREVQLGDEKNDKVCSFDPADLLARKLQHDDSFRKQVLAQSARLKTGELYETLPDGAISDVLEGAEARWHPHLWRPAEDDEEHDIRVPLEFNCDDVEVRRAARLRARAAACTHYRPIMRDRVRTDHRDARCRSVMRSA
jgi:hypothetical protein